jgi:hypothetical protein
MKRSVATAVAAVSLIALVACGSEEGKERKSPFATGNVSVAPQVEGRAAVATPIPAPRPSLEPTPAPPP